VIDWSVARLLVRNNKAFELQTAPILEVKGTVRSKLLKSFHVMVRRLLSVKTPIVVSSGANNVFEMRTPHDTAALTTLIGLPFEEGLKGVSINPENIVLKVFQRKTMAGIPEGVKIIQKENV
jgi:RNase P/RNase MRP subunit p30